MFEHPFFADNNAFQAFSPTHLGAVLTLLFFSIFLSLMGKYKWSRSTNIMVSRAIALCTSLSVVICTAIIIIKGTFDPALDLPLDICNLMAVLLPVIMWSPKYKCYEVLYFLVLAGTIQGVITPSLFQDFPHYVYWKFWMVHIGLMVYVIFMTVAFPEMKPTRKSMLRAFIVMNVYVAFIMMVNYFLDSNYVFVMRKPDVPSALDYMGPWPWYILLAQFIGLIFFFIVYAPVYFTRKNKNAT